MLHQLWKYRLCIFLEFVIPNEANTTVAPTTDNPGRYGLHLHGMEGVALKAVCVMKIFSVYITWSILQTWLETAMSFPGSSWDACGRCKEGWQWGPRVWEWPTEMVLHIWAMYLLATGSCGCWQLMWAHRETRQIKGGEINWELLNAQRPLSAQEVSETTCPGAGRILLGLARMRQQALLFHPSRGSCFWPWSDTSHGIRWMFRLTQRCPFYAPVLCSPAPVQMVHAG